jgi:hypothetical protein
MRRTPIRPAATGSLPRPLLEGEPARRVRVPTPSHHARTAQPLRTTAHATRHGAAPNRFMTHIGVQEADDTGNPVARGNHTTDEEYNAAPVIGPVTR